MKSVTIATIQVHSMRSGREDLHAIMILIRLLLKKKSFKTKEIVTSLYVRLLPITDSISSRDAKNPASNFDRKIDGYKKNVD